MFNRINIDQQFQIPRYIYSPHHIQMATVAATEQMMRNGINKHNYIILWSSLMHAYTSTRRILRQLLKLMVGPCQIYRVWSLLSVFRLIYMNSKENFSNHVSVIELIEGMCVCAPGLNEYRKSHEFARMGHGSFDTDFFFLNFHKLDETIWTDIWWNLRSHGRRMCFVNFFIVYRFRTTRSNRSISGK